MSIGYANDITLTCSSVYGLNYMLINNNDTIFYSANIQFDNNLYSVLYIIICV